MNSLIEKRYPSIKKMTDAYGIEIKEISFISGGRTNETFIVYDGRDKYIARIAGDGTEKIIDRKQELHNIRAAASVGIAPKVYCAIDGNLLVEFVEGISKKDPTMLYDPDTLDKVTTQLTDLHASNAQFKGEFSFLRNYNIYKEDYFTISREEPEALRKVEGEIVEMIQCMEEKYSGESGPIHGDTALQNFMICKERAYIIDWEYSSRGDCYLDLANFSVLNDLSPEIQTLFLNSYESKMLGKLDYGKFLLYKMAVSFMWIYWHLGRYVRNIQIDYNETHWKKCLRKSVSAKEEWETLGISL